MARIIQTADLVPQSALSADDKHWIYNGLDCCVTLEVLSKIKPQLDNTTTGTYEFSKSLQGPVLEMSLRGLLVDQAKRNEVLSLYKGQIVDIARQLDRLIEEGIGIKLNWRSSTQLKTLFYGVLGLNPIRHRNAKGIMVVTVNRDALERLADNFLAEPLVNRILKLRDIDKKRQFLETDIDTDGRMRTSINIAGTNTGRLASSTSVFQTGTNQQNIDRDLRSVFVADPGMKFANLDLEQADARNVGALCWNLFVETFSEEYAGAYLNACESGDLHTLVCRLGWPERPWTNNSFDDRKLADEIAYRQLTYRDLAKKLGHGTNYYGTPPTMARHTKVNRKDVERFQTRYFSGFPCIKSWHGRVKEELLDTSTLTTLFGRRRTFFGRNNDDTTLREAIAYAPQSMTADEIDIGLLRLWRAHRVQLMIQVHDSILIQYPEEQEDEIVPWAIQQLHVPLELARGRKFSVPVDAKVGWNWGDDKDSTGKVNPDGLIKWKGHDGRKRTEKPRLSIRDI